MVVASPPRVVENAYPLADTDAARCLRSALDRLKRERKKSLRAVARELNYKQPVTLSHMANGRMPIPVERAGEIALAVEIDSVMFTNLVLKQRYPEMSVKIDQADTAQFELSNGSSAVRSGHWEGQTLTPSQERVLREVMRDERAAERWLSPHEVGVVQLLRQLRPGLTADGLSQADIERLRSSLG